MSIYVGIDPGFSGGVGIIAPDHQVAWPMPVEGSGKDRLIDAAELLGLVTERGQVKMVVLEKVHSMPKQGLSSTFAFGKGFGQIIGMLQTAGLPFMFSTPQAWKKNILAGMGDKGKQAAIQVCGQLFPSVSLLKSYRSKVPHDGMADALCLAEYGRRVHGGA